MRPLAFFLALLILIVAPACKDTKSLAVTAAGKTRSLNLAQLREIAGDRLVTVDDHYLNRSVQYRALPLAALLRGLSGGAPYDEVLFHCADGYEARAAESAIAQGRLDSFYLAYGEGGESFVSTILQGKQEISPEPFYAVSTEKSGYEVLSWPYEVVALEFVRLAEKYAGLLPREVVVDQKKRAGFDLFRKECLRCHSINLQGGGVGPELNIPRNITEYREEAYLRAFIRNASAFRARSKMPAFSQLTEADLGQIIGYLKVMARYKTG